VALATAFLLMLPIGFAAELVMHRQSEWPAVGAALLRDVLGWVVFPALALLAGGLLVQSVIARGASRQQVPG
jgi:hypothetical protein